MAIGRERKRNTKQGMNDKNRYRERMKEIRILTKKKYKGLE